MALNKKAYALVYLDTDGNSFVLDGPTYTRAAARKQARRFGPGYLVKPIVDGRVAL